ncbi:MAG: hypothetical protein M0R73_03055 [Dehalococcoidia bacterium]|nr:hypothetical protein [Dehalococcoidia bacterium]
MTATDGIGVRTQHAVSGPAPPGIPRIHPPSPKLNERRPLGAYGLTFRMLEPASLTEAEEAGVIQLLRLAFNGGPGWFDLPVAQIDHFRWKLADYPYESFAYLGEFGAEIVGFGGRLNRRWLVNGLERVGRDGVEAALHPRYQNQGLTTLRRDIFDEFDYSEGFTLSFASHPSSLHNRRKRGTPSVANPMENLVRPLDVGRHIHPQHMANGATGASSRTRIALERGRTRQQRPEVVRRLAWEWRLLRHRLQHRPLHFRAGGWTIRTVDAFDQRIEAFFTDAATQFDLIQVRNQRFLNYRYADRRAGPFTIRLAEAEGQILGYSVVRATSDSGVLADLLALPGREDVADALIKDALTLARQAGAPSVRTWMMRHHPYHRLLVHAGFMQNQSIVEPGYEAKHMDPVELEFLADPQARVHIVIGDTDHV